MKRFVARKASIALGSSILLAGALAGCGSSSNNQSQQSQQSNATSNSQSSASGLNWKKYSGTTINVLLAKNPQSNYLVDHLSDFKALTGINVKVEQYPESVYHSKLSVIAAGRSSQYDGWTIEPVVDLFTETNAGWIQPIDSYLQNDLSSDFNYNDLFESTRKGSELNGHTWGLPYNDDVQLFYYRKDIFQKLNLTPPKTFDEWLKDAQTLQTEMPKNGYQGVYPVAVRASAAEGNAMLAVFYASEGGQWFKDNKFDLTSKPSIDAVNFFKQLMQYAPPGEANFGWEQVVPLFKQGKLAMFTDDSAFNSQITASDSKVNGKIGYAVLPGGAAGPKPWMLNWDLVINKFSKNPGAMWYFMQWASSPQTQTGFQRSGGTSARESAWQDPQAQKYAADHGQKDFYQAFFDSSKVAYPQWVPPMAQALAFRQVYGTALDNVLNGMDPTAAMSTANQQGDALLNQSK